MKKENSQELLHVRTSSHEVLQNLTLSRCSIDNLGEILYHSMPIPMWYSVIVVVPFLFSSLKNKIMTKPRVAFLHPDLGIGGAERLVIDAAVGLQNTGHTVAIFTAHRDTSHCFPEARDGTLDVHVNGDFMPRSVAGGFHALFAILRCLWASMVLCLFHRKKFDVIFVDQVSAVVPIFQWFGLKVLFYCHFPDLLLAGSRTSAIKRWYRFPLDYIEEKTTGMADIVLVNSNFTANTFRETFPSIKITPKILYPALDLEKFDIPASVDSLKKYSDIDLLILSINRYERKKNLGLAIETLAKLREIIDNVSFDALHLVYAGGYDKLVPENDQVLNELKAMASDYGVSEKITYVLSAPDDEKSALLERAICVTYTPQFEHFGIVPVEAMYLGVPVVACNSGGPLESIVNGETGFLCEPNADSFAKAIKSIITEKGLRKRMSKAAREHVKNNFSSDTFARHLGTYVAMCLD